MRNHAFVDEVVSKMIEYNHNEYLIDIDELISINKYGNAISNILIQIKNILSNDLNIVNTNYKVLKNYLKKYIFQIIIFENGHDCCLELLCK
jgi:hypothetical protein